MNEKEVHILLQRYFEGATSLNEERELQCYFSEGNIPDSLKAYRPMFAFFAVERAVEPPAQKPMARTIRMNWIIATGIAASIAILFMLSLPKMQNDNYVYLVDGQRIYDETAAIALAENKLQLLAESMQKAHNSMSTFDKVQGSNQSLQQLSKISNAYRQIEMVNTKIDEFKRN